MNPLTVPLIEAMYSRTFLLRVSGVSVDNVSGYWTPNSYVLLLSALDKHHLDLKVYTLWDGLSDETPLHHSACPFHGGGGGSRTSTEEWFERRVDCDPVCVFLKQFIIVYLLPKCI